MLDYKQAKRVYFMNNDAVDKAALDIHLKINELAERLDIAEPIHANGLTVERIRMHPEYKMVKGVYEQTKKAAGAYNKQFLAMFKKELRKERSENMARGTLGLTRE